MGGDEGSVGFVVEAEGFAAGEVEGESVFGVGDGEGGAGLEEGVERVRRTSWLRVPEKSPGPARWLPDWGMLRFTRVAGDYWHRVRVGCG